MNHLFANYELSLLAKEKGFKDFCFAGYVEINTKEFQFMMNSQIDSIDEAIGLGDNLITKAPLFQQLVDWFRKKHKIVITISYCEYGIKTENGWRFTFDNPTGQQHWQGKSNSYYKALIKAIEEGFKLI